jgi:cyclopropane-fatty-acyl-phospholipid synthase
LNVISGAYRRRRASAAKVARRVLDRLGEGRLTRLPVSIRFWDGSVLTPAISNGAPVVVARHRRAISHLLYQPGQIGLARAWVDGSLTVQGDLDDVLATRRAFADVTVSPADRLRLVLAAIRVAGPAVLRRPPAPAIEASVRGRRHSLSRDRSSVRHHYDLSNDFYRLVLGPSMVYSCAYFSGEDQSLEQAQEQKLDLICRKLRLGPGERLLDVGCGWGSLVLHAAANYDVEAVGVTLSEPQAAFARRRARERGLSSRVEIRVADYRELSDGPFDKIASVGMYEHVGRAEVPHYVAVISQLLRPGGLFLNHGIARLYSEQLDSETFISRYVFPDGELHPITELISALQPNGLELRDTESLREHYPLTLRRWAANLVAHRPEAEALVGAERVRAWQLYMIGSAQAFEDAEITVFHVLSARDGASAGLPLDRADLLGLPGADRPSPAPGSAADRFTPAAGPAADRFTRATGPAADRFTPAAGPAGDRTPAAGPAARRPTPSTRPAPFPGQPD